MVHCPDNGHKWDSLLEEETGDAGSGVSERGDGIRIA